MSKRKVTDDANSIPTRKKSRTSSLVESREAQNESFPQTVFNDTEAALIFIKKTLLDENRKDSFPPIVFVHQLYDIVDNRTVVNRQLVN